MFLIDRIPHYPKNAQVAHVLSPCICLVHRVKASHHPFRGVYVCCDPGIPNIYRDKDIAGFEPLESELEYCHIVILSALSKFLINWSTIECEVAIKVLGMLSIVWFPNIWDTISLMDQCIRLTKLVQYTPTRIFHYACWTVSY